MLGKGQENKDGETITGLEMNSSRVTSESFQESGGRKLGQGVGSRKWNDEWLHFSFRKFGRERGERTGS